MAQPISIAWRTAFRLDWSAAESSGSRHSAACRPSATKVTSDVALFVHSQRSVSASTPSEENRSGGFGGRFAEWDGGGCSPTCW